VSARGGSPFFNTLVSASGRFRQLKDRPITPL
jgi:hypothetical protein